MVWLRANIGAVRWYQQAADQGNHQNLWLCYTHGGGVDQIDTDAVVLYQKAAGQGNVQAQVIVMALA
jgi:hypothetical protein